MQYTLARLAGAAALLTFLLGGLTLDGTASLTGSTSLNPASGAPPTDSARADTTAPFFEDVSARLGHTHTETPYQDFSRQPLLPRRLSQQGPGVAWTDADRDGTPDLLIGTGRGGRLTYYRNDGTGRFTEAATSAPVERDLTGLVALPQEEGTLVLAGVSNYERQPDEDVQPSRIRVYRLQDGTLEQVDRLSFGRSAVGPLALADFDGNGTLDLFAGGRHVPGRYPEPASSRLYLNRGDGTFQADDVRSQPFRDVGLVSGAVAADLDGDNDPDLALATEWGPLRIFENTGDAQFREVTEAAGLAPYTGWWQGVTVGDFNEDGHLDLVATNWGWNSAYGHPEGVPSDSTAARLPHPVHLYYADFDRNGILDIIETRYIPDREAHLPVEDLPVLLRNLPYLRRRVRSFEAFADASLGEILGPDRLARADTAAATTPSHMVFFGQDGEGIRFDGRPLPAYAQLAPAFDVSVADFDGDGHDDLFLSQNFFALPARKDRLDGGRGLWLRGDGTGRFTPLRGQHSGVTVYGEQRAAPVADIDGDARTDLIVTQNGAATKLYRNTGAQPGVRVALQGPEGNPAGLGAEVRLQYADGTTGGVRVVTAGSGYWSQRSATPVLGTGDHAVEAVEVTWPDGRTTTAPVPDDAQTVTVSYEGSGT
jgi:hypothetical protein